VIDVLGGESDFVIRNRSSGEFEPLTLVTVFQAVACDSPSFVHATGRRGTYVDGIRGLPASSWTNDSTNVWKTSITSSSFNYVMFGYVGAMGRWAASGDEVYYQQTQLVSPINSFF